MNPKVILLACATFATGTAENIIVGILPDVSRGLGVSLTLAGQLTAVFSIVFAAAAPLALVLMTRVERKRLLLCALGLFIASNLAAAASPDFTTMFAARVAMAMASATVCLVATMLATDLVEERLRGRAIGVLFMGISGSLVLGVPTGMVISDIAGWRGVFVVLALLAALVLLAGWYSLPVSDIRKPMRSGYRAHLRKIPLVAAQLVSVLMIGGHFVLFAFLAPYLNEVVGLDGGNVVLAFFALGLAGVSGGFLGGWFADCCSPRIALLLTPAAYLLALVAIPLLQGMPWPTFAAMMIWACVSWMISPVVQSFLISRGPDTAEAGISLNFSAMHIGVGLGTGIGGLSLGALWVHALPWIGAGLAALAVVSGGAALWCKPATSLTITAEGLSSPQ